MCFEKLRESAKQGNFIILKDRDQLGRRIIVQQIGIIIIFYLSFSI